MNRERIYVRETFSMFIYSSIGIWKICCTRQVIYWFDYVWSIETFSSFFSVLHHNGHTRTWCMISIWKVLNPQSIKHEDSFISLPITTKVSRDWSSIFTTFIHIFMNFGSSVEDRNAEHHMSDLTICWNACTHCF
jgi:hypothetical protein